MKPSGTTTVYCCPVEPQEVSHWLNPERLKWCLRVLLIKSVLSAKCKMTIQHWWYQFCNMHTVGVGGIHDFREYSKLFHKCGTVNYYGSDTDTCYTVIPTRKQFTSFMSVRSNEMCEYSSEGEVELWNRPMMSWETLKQVVKQYCSIDGCQINIFAG